MARDVLLLAYAAVTTPLGAVKEVPMMHKAATALCSLTLLMSAHASETLRVALPDRAALVIDVPEGWHAQVSQAQANLAPTIVLTGAKAHTFQVSISPSWPQGAAKAPLASDIHALVHSEALKAKAHALEPELKLTDLDASGKSGYYFSATERQPAPEGFSHLTQGALSLNELRVDFSVLANGDSASDTRATALEVMRSMRRGGQGTVPR